MKAEELRIGNLVQLPALVDEGSKMTEKICKDFGYTVVPVNSSIIRDAEHYGEDWAGKPIPLTEEWLIDLGAKGRISPLWISLTNLKSELHFECHESGEIVTMLKGDFADLILDRLKYVHELQNLYFALTGTELTIKQ